MNELIAALFKLVLPVAILTYVMVSWALENGHLKENGKIRDLKKDMKALSKDKSKEKQKQNAIHRQWTKFGGGFYGIVALYTFGLVEWQELRSFIANFGGFVAFIKQLGLETIIQIFIEGLKNFITAIAWPFYWMSEFGSGQFWVWGGMAYGAYWLGARYAQRMAAKQSVNDEGDPANVEISDQDKDAGNGC